jgi:hypothetical protein
LKYALVLLIACGGSKTPPPPSHAGPPPGKVAAATVEQCDRLLLHLVDLEFARAGGSVSQESRQAVIDSKRTEFQAVCVDKTPAHRVECALAARDLDGVTKCDEAP